MQEDAGYKMLRGVPCIVGGDAGLPEAMDGGSNRVVEMQWCWQRRTCCGSRWDVFGPPVKEVNERTAQSTTDILFSILSTMAAVAVGQGAGEPGAADPPAGPSRTAHGDTWEPKRYLEPNHPDNEEVLEQAAYQAAVTRPPGDSRQQRKYKPRRTVDYMGGVQKWRMLGKKNGLPGYLPPIRPNPSDIINVRDGVGILLTTRSSPRQPTSTTPRPPSVTTLSTPRSTRSAPRPEWCR